MADSMPLPARVPLEAAPWEQTPLAVRPWVVPPADRLRTLEARMAALDACVPQRSRHAARPPSSAPPEEQPTARAGAQGRPGAKPGHPGPRQALLEPTQVIEVKPLACVGGQTACLDTSPDDTPQVIERPEIRMLVRHVVLDEAYGPQWGHVTTAQGPPAATAGQGPRRTALIGERSGRQRARRRAGQACCRSVLGGHLSRGALQGAVDRVSAAIEPDDEAMAAQARQAPVNDMDETAWYQQGVLAWLGVMVNPPVAFFTVPASRSQTAFEAWGKPWAGILVRDGDGVDCQGVHTRQTCLAHLRRRARGLAERQAPELAGFGRRGLAERQRLVPGAQAPPTAGDGPTGYARRGHRRGQHRDRQEAAGTFARTLERELGALGTLVVEAGVDATKHRAERALRFAGRWRKRRQGTDNEKGDRWVERLLSRRETCRLRGLPTFPVLVDAVTCDFNGRHPDVSWI